MLYILFLMIGIISCAIGVIFNSAIAQAIADMALVIAIIIDKSSRQR